MKVATISANQVAFRDDNTYIPPRYNEFDAMRDLRKEGYILKGPVAKDAFEKFYKDVDAKLAKTAEPPSGVWFSEHIETGKGLGDRKVKFAVDRWSLTKDEFTRLLTRFWEDNKLSNFKDVKLAITNFLTNREGLTKPSFWQIFSSSAAKYNIRSATIETVVDNFIKTGKHTLK